MTNQRTPAKIIPRAFPGIQPDEVEEIIANSRIQTYAADTVVCKEDAIEHTFYMILEGEFEVTKIINNSETRLLKTLKSGDFFGEMALIHNAPRAATVKALSNVIVLELDKEGFDRVLKRSPSVAMAMVAEISNRLRQNDLLAIEDLRLRAAELADAYQKLAEQDLARQEFLTTIAHELRTPLMIASGYLHALQKGILPSEKTEETIETVTRSVDQIVTLTNDILFLQEVDLVLAEFQAVKIDEVVNAAVAKLQRKLLEKNIKINVKNEKNVQKVQGDAQSLERAIMALLDNAIKFSAPGGLVEVRMTEYGDHIKIAIEDHGSGISPDIRPRIFDRFVHHENNDDELKSGLGIGLSITRQVIKQHKGALDVESEPRKGSTFTVTLSKWR